MLKSDSAEAAVSLLFRLSHSLILYECLFYWLLYPFLAILCPPSLPPHRERERRGRGRPSLFSIHSFSHYWSVSALENCCACRASVITSGINHFPCAWLEEARLIPAFLYTPSRATDREKPYWLLLKAWYNSECWGLFKFVAKAKHRPSQEKKKPTWFHYQGSKYTI